MYQFSLQSDLPNLQFCFLVVLSFKIHFSTYFSVLNLVKVTVSPMRRTFFLIIFYIKSVLDKNRFIFFHELQFSVLYLSCDLGAALLHLHVNKVVLFIYTNSFAQSHFLLFFFNYSNKNKFFSCVTSYTVFIFCKSSLCYEEGTLITPEKLICNTMWSHNIFQCFVNCYKITFFSFSSETDFKVFQTLLTSYCPCGNQTDWLSAAM